MEIRDYQQKMVDELVSSPAKTMVQMHTGSGKTALGAYFARRLKEATGSRTLILAHRRELVQQWQDTIVEVGLQSAMVVTIQQLTYQQQMQKLFRRYGSADLLIIDECHHYIDNVWSEAFHRWKGRVLGLTATPWRIERYRGFHKDQEGRRMWQRLIVGPPRAALIERGALVPTVVKSPFFGVIGSGEEVEALKTFGKGRGGSKDSDFSVTDMMQRFHESQAMKAAMTEKGVDWLVEERSEGRAKQTIVFGLNQKHAEALLKECSKRNITSAAVVTSKTPKDERQDAIKAFEREKLDTLITVAVLTEGVDLPVCDSVLMVRPTY